MAAGGYRERIGRTKVEVMSMVEDEDEAIRRDLQAGTRFMAGCMLALAVLVAMGVWAFYGVRSRAYRQGYGAGVASAARPTPQPVDGIALSSCLVRMRDLELEHQDQMAHLRSSLTTPQRPTRDRYVEGLNEGLRLGREDWTVQDWECLGPARARAR